MWDNSASVPHFDWLRFIKVKTSLRGKLWPIKKKYADLCIYSHEGLADRNMAERKVGAQRQSSFIN